MLFLKSIIINLIIIWVLINLVFCLINLTQNLIYLQLILSYFNGKRPKPTNFWSNNWGVEGRNPKTIRSSDSPFADCNRSNQFDRQALISRSEVFRPTTSDGWFDLEMYLHLVRSQPKKHESLIIVLKMNTIFFFYFWIINNFFSFKETSWLLGRIKENATRPTFLSVIAQLW